MSSVTSLAVSGVFLLFIFYLLYQTTHAVVYTCFGHCHHLSVECLALEPTGKSYPPLRQEMQEAFRPEHMRHDAECARVDFPCSSLEQDLRKGKMMTMTYTPSTARFLHCSTGTASATSILPLLFQKLSAFYRKSSCKPNVHFLLNGQKKVNRKKSRPHWSLRWLVLHPFAGIRTELTRPLKNIP